MVCNKCGTTADSGLFCLKCGGQMIKQGSQTQPIPTPPPSYQQQYTPPPIQQQPGNFNLKVKNSFYEFLYKGSFAMLRIKLGAGERLKAESGAMVAMSSTIDVEGKLEGGILGGLGRMLTGEKFFFQSLVANRGEGEVLLSPAALGDLAYINMDTNVPYILQKDGFFAASEEVNITTTMQNLSKGLFSGEGFFVIKASGRGALFVSSYGAIHELDIPSGQNMIIDNAHLVAWPENMHFNIERASSGWISSITSGEGLVCRFHGPGKVLIQSRNPKGFVQWVSSMIGAGGHSKSSGGSGGLIQGLLSGNI